MRAYFENNKIIWKVKRMRKSTSSREEKVNTTDGRMLNEKDDVRKRWSLHFKRLLNVEEYKEAEIVAVGREQGLHEPQDLTDSYIIYEEVQEAVREMKANKSVN